MDPSSGDDDASWMILFDGAEIRQAADTNGSAVLLSKDNIGPLYYRGTWYVNSDVCLGYVGFIFGYQNNQKFYAVMWKHQHYNWYTSIRGGIKGLQLKLIESAGGPAANADLAEALFHSDDTSSEVTLLWHDLDLVGWECKTAYRWEVQHRPDIGVINIVIKQGETVLVSSGDIYDTTISGGRAGLFVHAQPGAIFSNLKYKCLDRVNKGMQFDGVDDYLNITDILTLESEHSITWEVWVYLLPTTEVNATWPLICNSDQTLCLFINVSGSQYFVGGRYASYTASGTTSIPEYSWTHLVMRYDSEGCILNLFVNGTTTPAEADVTGVPRTDWEALSTAANTTVNNTDIYIATDLTNFYSGILDEVRMYSLYIFDSEIADHWQDSGTFWESHKRYVQAHYNFDRNGDDTYVEDKSWQLHKAMISGNPVYVDSYVDQTRFELTFPGNKRRRRRRRSLALQEREEIQREKRDNREKHLRKLQSIHSLKQSSFHRHNGSSILQLGRDGWKRSKWGVDEKFEEYLLGHDEF